MARNINSSIYNDLDDGELVPYFAVDFYLPDPSNPNLAIIDRMWNGYRDRDITINGQQNTYTALGGLISIGDTSEHGDLTANGIEVKVMATTEIIATLRDVEYQGMPFRVYLGTQYSVHNIPQDEPFVYFDGFVDKIQFLQTPTTVEVTITAEHKFVRLSEAKNRTYTASDQNLENSVDKGFNYLNATRNGVFSWGTV